MHGELIGKQASFRLPCLVDAPKLLLGFVDELMQVSGARAAEPRQLEREMRSAVDALRDRDNDCPARGDLLAVLTIRDRSIEIRLSRAGDEMAGADARALTLTVSEA